MLFNTAIIYAYTESIILLLQVANFILIWGYCTQSGDALRQICVGIAWLGLDLSGRDAHGRAEYKEKRYNLSNHDWTQSHVEWPLARFVPKQPPPRQSAWTAADCDKQQELVFRNSAQLGFGSRLVRAKCCKSHQIDENQIGEYQQPNFRVFNYLRYLRQLCCSLKPSICLALKLE